MVRGAIDIFLKAGGRIACGLRPAAKKEEKKNGKAEKLSKEQQMARHGALLRRMLHDYSVRQWKIEIDGKRYFRPLYSLGGDEHRLSGPGSTWRRAPRPGMGN